MRLLFAATFVFLALVPAATAIEPVGPALETPEATLRAALTCPETFDGSHEPVLLVHGTFVNSDINWGWSYVPALTKAGFDACTVDLPNNGLDDIQIASEYVVFAVREIAQRSGEQVDTIGVSQGGLEPRWAIKWWPDVRATVDDHVMLATPNHGVEWRPSDGFDCMPACWQMARDSNFIAALNSSDETPGDVSYTSIYTQFDVLVPPSPRNTSALDGASNILVQDVCPLRPVDHATMSGDAVTYSLVLDALTSPGPADPERLPASTCNQTGMPGAEYDKGQQPVVDEIASGGPEWHFVGEEPPLKPYAQT